MPLCPATCPPCSSGHDDPVVLTACAPFCCQQVVELLRQDLQHRDLQVGSPVVSTPRLAGGVRTTWSTSAGDRGRALGVLILSIMLSADNFQENSE